MTKHEISKWMKRHLPQIKIKKPPLPMLVWLGMSTTVLVVALISIGVLVGNDHAATPESDSIAAVTVQAAEATASVAKPTGVAQNAKYIRNGKDKNGKYTMYLTFDDGPYKSTKSILKTLKKNNIKATFFVVGKQVEKYPEIARQIVKDGHTIAVHCYEHDYKKIYKSVESYKKDFKKARKAIYKATGVRPTLFRFPGGSKNSFNTKTRKKIIKQMKKDGYTYYDWNAMFGDAGECDTAAEVVRFAKRQVGKGKDIVMLAHDAGARDNTKKALQKVIDQFKRKYNFAGLTPKTKPVQW